MNLTNLENSAKFDVIIRALDASKEIRDQLNNVDHLNSTINGDNMASLIKSASDIGSCAKEYPLTHADYNRILGNKLELETIVNYPRRLSLCVDSSNRFPEAIQIMDQIETLSKQYGQQCPIISLIQEQSEKQRKYLVANLCSRLENIKEISKDEVHHLVNYLIMCGNFSGRELRLKYLKARDNWFNNCCREERHSFDKLVSVYSTGLPRIFDEYKSIFSDSSEIFDRTQIGMSAADNAKEDGAIINSWLLLKATIFISSLNSYLKTVHQTRTLTPTMIADTMKKCFELTDRLASIGFDFSSRLRPLFSNALIEEIKSNIDRATTSFESNFTSSVSRSIESLLLPVDDEILRISSMKADEQLPKSIEHYPMFRIFCLYIIDSLRWLQTTKNILSPISLCLDTYAALNASLTRVMKALAIVLNTDNNSNHPILSKIAISFMTEVLPFFGNYCELIFPEKAILSAIGLTKSEFKTITATEPNELRNFRLDLRQIADPLRSTMPALMQTIEH